MSYLLSTLPRHQYSFTVVQPSLTPGLDVLGKRPVAAHAVLVAVGTLLVAAGTDLVAAGMHLVAAGMLLAAAGMLLAAAGMLLVVVGMHLVAPWTGLAASACASQSSSERHWSLS